MKMAHWARRVVATVTILLPWALRRRLLRFVGFSLHPSSRIGMSIIWADRVEMAESSQIGHFTVVRGLAEVHIGEHGRIGNLNWISACPSHETGHFAHETSRNPSLYVGRHAAITNRHIIDCTNTITIGEFATVAGFRSVLLTHSIDLLQCRQSSSPIVIGSYSFIGTCCTILAGAALPSHSVLGAKSLLNRAFAERYCLYGGVPAAPLKKIDVQMKYFRRTKGFVQ